MKNFIKRIEVGGRDNTVCILQQGQCVGWLFLLLDVIINKGFHSYFAFQNLDLSLGINNLKGNVFKYMMYLLVNSFLFSHKTNMM